MDGEERRRKLRIYNLVWFVLFVPYAVLMGGLLGLVVVAYGNQAAGNYVMEPGEEIGSFVAIMFCGAISVVFQLLSLPMCFANYADADKRYREVGRFAFDYARMSFVSVGLGGFVYYWFWGRHRPNVQENDS